MDYLYYTEIRTFVLWTALEFFLCACWYTWWYCTIIWHLIFVLKPTIASRIGKKCTWLWSPRRRMWIIPTLSERLIRFEKQASYECAYTLYHLIPFHLMLFHSIPLHTDSFVRSPIFILSWGPTRQSCSASLRRIRERRCTNSWRVLQGVFAWRAWVQGLGVVA